MPTTRPSRILLAALGGTALTIGVGYGLARTAPLEHTYIVEQRDIDLIDIVEPTLVGPGVRFESAMAWTGTLGTGSDRILRPFRYTAGWPLPAVGTGHQQVAILDVALDGVERSQVPLPRRALPRGFAVNTLLGSACLFVLLELATAVTRRLRGRCPRCSYPIRTDAERCSECGRRIGRRRGNG